MASPTTPSSSSTSTQQQQPQHHPPPPLRRRRNRQRRLVLLPAAAVLLAVAGLSLLQAALAVNQVYDETGWTKREWHKYKIEVDLHSGPDPADDVLAHSAALRKHLQESALNSLHGPVKRRSVSKFAGMWARDDGTLVASPSEDAVEQAAEAAMCTTCHSLVSHVWGQLVWSINHAEPLSESSVKDLVEEACEAHVRHKVLSKYRIVQVDAPELDVSLFVVRERKSVTSTPAAAAAAATDAKLPDDSKSKSSSGDGSSSGKAAAAAGKSGSSSSGGSSSQAAAEDGTTSSSSSGKGGEAQQQGLPAMPADVTSAEMEAVQKACSDLAMHHAAALQKQLWPQAKAYFTERLTLAQKILTKAQWYNDDSFWEPDAYEDPEDDDDDDDDDSSDEDESSDTSLSMDSIKLKAAQKLTPADQLCLDMDIMCPYWAQQGQCTANPKYMVGDRKHLGHCKASCEVCEPKSIWKKHPLVKQELKKSAAAAGQLLRTSACSASRACMAGGSGSTIGGTAAVKDTASLLPGAVLAKTPGFVLGKPFWAVPVVTTSDDGGLSAAERVTDPALQDAADETLLSEGLGSKKVAIPGMDNYFMYQLEYRRRVYQYAKDKATGKVKEEHVLGLFDPAATAKAARRDTLAAAAAAASAAAGGATHPAHDAGKAWQAQWKLQRDASKHGGGGKAAAAGAGKGSAGGKAGAGGAKGDVSAQTPPPAPPMLELLDYLPDTESMLASHWPFMRQMYTGGETCQVEGRAVDRQVELRAACSPDGSLHMLVREPSFCQYVMVLYHPQLCEVDRLKPVPVLGAGSGSGSKKGSGSASKSAAGSEKGAAGSSAKKATAAGSPSSGGAAAAAAKAKAKVPPPAEVQEQNTKKGSGSKSKLSTS